MVCRYLHNKTLLADKGYKSIQISNKLKNDFNCNIILPNNHSFYPCHCDKLLYKKRIFIEHLFSKIKNYKRLANNYEKNINNFYNFVYLSLVQLYLVGYIGKY